ncbi:beta-galactosidase [Stieleria sp. ICT_E10.1]|uniref:beta-galactosidase n=1 Tax=Stieleria sedimenti TaxID=2976331 RepID=UPI00217FCE53|nr:beta-galactosidase [Stieleria sedimenti]MCS7466045.1 beta-galactosidase [Stieleria sedimenti]
MPSFAQTLSKEGRDQEAIHDYLFDSFIQGCETKYVGGGRDRGLKEVTILQETIELGHGDDVLLPEGAERVAGLFRHFAFHGANLDRVKEVYVFPFSPDKSPPRSQQVKDFYRVQMPSIPLSDQPPERMKVRFLMKDEDATCRIDDLVFIAQKQIPPEFDTIPYRDLGSEFPRERVEIDIDTDHELSIGGTSQLQRDRWFRMHETPGVVDPSFERWAAERNFLPGRGAFKFNPGITRAWGNWEPLKEREDKPGAADLSFFDQYDAGVRHRNTIPEFKNIPFAYCFNDWPEFMSVPLVGRGTPKIEHFDDAAELAAAYVEDQIKDGGFTAEWWEVKNESSVQSEWAHHWKESQGIDGWGLLAEFHNRVADAVHQRAPEVKVGGPSSAYMQLQVKDFDLYRNQARFIEQTRGHIDFYSHHFYENALMLGAHERRGQGYSNYLLGRYEAILDMLRAHMLKADNVLPILITECGSLQNGRQPSDNWLRLLAWNAYLTKSMQRPDQIDLFVPFVFLHMSWNPYSGDAAFTPKEDRKRHRSIDDFEPTAIANYFELWRDFDGRRLPVAFDRDWLDVVAVHDGNRISLAVTNMGGRQIAVDLSNVATRIGSERATQTRLNYHQGQIVFQPEHDVDTAAIPVDVNETTVIRLMPGKPIAPEKTLVLDRWYATETVVKSDGSPLSFDVRIDNPSQTHSAQLIIGAHRRGGLTEPVLVKINGNPIDIDTGDADEFSEYFAPLNASIPASLLQHHNKVEIQPQQDTTITSVQILTHQASNDASRDPQPTVLFDFEDDQQLESIETRDIQISRLKSDSGSALLLESGHQIDWPGITLKPTQGVWDLGMFQHLSFDVVNQGDKPFEIGLKIESRDAKGNEKNFTVMNNIAAKESRKISGTLYTTPWKFTSSFQVQGMHAAPGQKKVDPSSVTQAVIFLRQPNEDYRFTIDNVKVETPMTSMDVDEFLPFIDEFGQFIHKQWHGKTHSQEDLVASREAEKKELAGNPGPASFNRFGGWKDSSQHGPAKFFRVEKHDGRWWLIDPDGCRFWSHGMDAVSTRFGGTGIEHRENYFRGLPKEGSKLGKYYFASTWAFGFYADKTPFKMYNHLLANLHRKYGDDHRTEFEDISHKRLRSWGFNTLASWCDESVNRQKRTSYVEFVYVEDGPVLEGAQKMWTQFHDVFDPRFRQSIAHGIEKVKYSVGDPWCMGYYVDNELYWGSDIDLALWTLRCSSKQAAKQEFIKDLTAKYETIDALNQAWGTEHASWSDLAEATQTPDVNKANEDLRQFAKKTSETYFRSVKEELANTAPGQLYLGCRFIWDNETAIRAACLYADVVSFNRYLYSVDQMSLPKGEDKPILVGEFHFGALDRGLFHPTRAPAKNQTNRAECYKNYVLSALRNPLFVGTHWFQYYDEPTAGRGDGENYNTGFLDICDTPYPEMVSAAREVAERMYEYRAGR